MLDLMGDLRTHRFFNEDPSLLQGIRAYQDGDPMRFVSWYATARTQQLMGKEVRAYNDSPLPACIVWGY